ALTIAALCCAAPLLGQEPAAPKTPAMAAPKSAATPAAQPRTSATAAAIDPAKRAAIKQLMDLTETPKLAEGISSEISSRVRSVVGRSMPQDRLEEFMTAFDQKLHARASEGGIEELIIPIYAQHFSAEDIQELIRFYQSPLGQRVVKTLPLVAEQSQDAGLRYERDAALATLHDMSDEYPELKPMLPDQEPAPGAPARPAPGAQPPATPRPAAPGVPAKPHQ